MLSNRRVVLLGLQLFRMELLVFLNCVVVPRAGARYKLDLFAVSFGHFLILRRLGALSLCLYVGKNLLDAVLVDDAHAAMRHTQAYPAFLGFQPKTLVLQVGQKTATRPVICVRNVISGLWALAGDLTYLGHLLKSLILLKVAHGLWAESGTLYQPDWRNTRVCHMSPRLAIDVA